MNFGVLAVAILLVISAITLAPAPASSGNSGRLFECQINFDADPLRNGHNLTPSSLTTQVRRKAKNKLFFDEATGLLRVSGSSPIKFEIIESPLPSQNDLTAIWVLEAPGTTSVSLIRIRHWGKPITFVLYLSDELYGGTCMVP